MLGGVLTEEKAPDELRLAAATALDQFGTEASPAIPALLKAVADPEKVVRCLALQMLGRMGRRLDEKRADAVPVILKATDDASLEVRVAALEALGAMADFGFGGHREKVEKVVAGIIRREGRKDILAAAKAAMAKINPKK
jgi:HEAT repeat protein